jgi:hypothetical protein
MFTLLPYKLNRLPSSEMKLLANSEVEGTVLK